SEPQQYYKKIAENVAGTYTIHTGGTYVYISNTKNRTVRFTSPGLKTSNIAEDQIIQWLQKIQLRFPQF
ncbi:MAG: hypothetical protein J0I84_20340, partial [Terrimonas sp.]|nr:hypothetical protein [Terrimonas sp.]